MMLYYFIYIQLEKSGEAITITSPFISPSVSDGSENRARMAMKCFDDAGNILTPLFPLY